MFKRYHYLSHELHRSAECYVGLIEGKEAAFCAVINFPHAQVPNFKAVSRLVVLPDYQGVGLAARMLDFVAGLYAQRKNRVIITTGNPAMKRSLERDKNWMLRRQGRTNPHGESKLTGMKSSGSNRRVTTAWEYTGLET